MQKKKNVELNGYENCKLHKLCNNCIYVGPKFYISKICYVALSKFCKAFMEAGNQIRD